MSTEQPTRSVDLSVVVPGSPEEVWAAIATGAGISSWFVPSTVEGRVGGLVASDFGAFGKDEGTVTAYDPPMRYAALGGGQPDDGRVVATEWVVEALDGASCTVRLVHSGFRTGTEWDGEYNGMVEGWKLFLENLCLHLTHFKGERADAVIPTRMLAGPNEAAWSRLCDALGVPADLAVGDAIATAATAPVALRGQVHHAQRAAAVSDYLLVLDGPLRGTALLAAEGDGDAVAASAWLYLYGTDTAPVQHALDETFAALATST